MSQRGSNEALMCWGANIDEAGKTDYQKSILLDATYKALTDAFVAGPSCEMQGDLVTIALEVELKGASGTLYAQLEGSHDGSNWFTLTAGTPLTVVGVAPDEELEHELLPFTRTIVLKDGHKRIFSYNCRAPFVRLKLRADVAGATVRAYLYR